MNKSRYNELIVFPHLYQKEEVKELEELANQFPYSQGIKQLHLKLLYIEEDVKFEIALKKTAAYTFDRAALKNYILKDALLFEVNPNSKYSPSEVLEDSKIVEEQTSLDSGIDPAVGPIVIETDTTHQINEQKLDNTTTKDLLAEAINASISVEMGKPFVEKKIVNVSNVIAPSTLNENSSDNKKTFLDWLNGYENNQKEKAKEKSEFKAKAEFLIDEFINSQAKIVPKRDFYSPVNMADQSVKEANDLASETLAQIYFAQGKSAKAIKCYETLILKFPEKKTYFASRIENIKQSNKK